MSDNFNINPGTEPVATPVPNSDNTPPAFDYQPPQVEIPQAPTFEAPVQAEPTQMPVVEQAPVQAEMPQPTPYQPQQAPYQPNAQAYQPQQAPYQPNAQAYQPQQAPYQPNVQGYQPQQTAYQNDPSQQSQTHATGYYQYTPVDPVMVNGQNQTDGYAVASLILGIVGILTCCTFIPGILGLIFGIISKSSNDGTRPSGVATAGIITSAIALAINIFFMFLSFI